jgi:hypothetical protein
MHYTTTTHTIDEPEKTNIPKGKTMHYTPLLTTSTDTSMAFIWEKGKMCLYKNSP